MWALSIPPRWRRRSRARRWLRNRVLGPRRSNSEVARPRTTRWLAWVTMPSASGVQIRCLGGRRLDVDELAVGVANQEVGRAHAVGLDHRHDRLVEGPGVEDLAAPHVDRLGERGSAVVRAHQAVHAEPDAGLVDADLAADDSGLGEADEIGQVRASGAQHEGVAANAGEPVPVLSHQGAAVGRSPRPSARTPCSRREARRRRPKPWPRRRRPNTQSPSARSAPRRRGTRARHLRRFRASRRRTRRCLRR